MSGDTTKRPSFQFYPADWLSNTELRMVSMGARGLWIYIVCLMHQQVPYGHLLKANGKAMRAKDIVAVIGGNEEEIQKWLDELLEEGVCFLNDDGVIYSRRMVRDEEKRNAQAGAGKSGGNPALVGASNEPGFVYAVQRLSDSAVKLSASKHPAKQVYKLRQQSPEDSMALIGQLHVEDMAAAHAELLVIFGGKKAGEWCVLDQGELDNLLNVHLKAKVKEGITFTTPTPSTTPTSGKPKPPKKKSKPILDSSTTNATRLSSDWRLPKPWGLWAKQFDPGWTDDYIRQLGESFRDYWTALPNNSRAKKTDWLATWRNFIRQRVPPSRDANGKARRGRHWHDTEQGIKDKAADIGFTIPPGWTLTQVVDGIIAKMDELDRKGEIPNAKEQPKTGIALEPESSHMSPEEAKQARESALAIAREMTKKRRGVSSDDAGEAA